MRAQAPDVECAAAVPSRFSRTDPSRILEENALRGSARGVKLLSEGMAKAGPKVSGSVNPLI
jgi:hypothetical protein